MRDCNSNSANVLQISSPFPSAAPPLQFAISLGYSEKTRDEALNVFNVQFLSDLSQDLSLSSQNFFIPRQECYVLGSVAGDEVRETLQQLEVVFTQRLSRAVERERLLLFLSSEAAAAP